MNQEDLNALMRNPWEAAKKPRPQPLPECPQYVRALVMRERIEAHQSLQQWERQAVQMVLTA